MSRFEEIKKVYNSILNDGIVNTSRKISSNTRINARAGQITVILHDTPVFRLDLTARRVSLNSGGWHTVTTRKVINECLQACGLDSKFNISCRGGYFLINGVKSPAYNDFNI